MEINWPGAHGTERTTTLMEAILLLGNPLYEKDLLRS